MPLQFVILNLATYLNFTEKLLNLIFPKFFKIHQTLIFRSFCKNSVDHKKIRKYLCTLNNIYVPLIELHDDVLRLLESFSGETLLTIAIVANKGLKKCRFNGTRIYVLAISEERPYKRSHQLG